MRSIYRKQVEKSEINQAEVISYDHHLGKTVQGTGGATVHSLAGRIQEVSLVAKHKARTQARVQLLVNHLIRWSKEHEASITTSVKSLCEDRLTKQTASSLRAIFAAYQPEAILVATQLLAAVEEQYGPVPDVLVAADVVLTRYGYELHADFAECAISPARVGGAA